MRRKLKSKRPLLADYRYQSPKVTKLINYVMEKGHKAIAQDIVYSAFDEIKATTKKEPVEVFEAALQNSGPLMEIKTRRVGGANYQIPHEVSDARKLTLSLRWILEFARAKKGKRMQSKLAEEIMMAATKTISAVTNASPAVATATAHGYSDLDPVLLSSGWEDANNTIWEVDSQTADTFNITGLDSSSTTYYPAGSGVGTASKVSSWVEIPQILTIASNGGGPKYNTVSPLATRNDIKVPVGFEASSIDLEIGYDPTNATQAAMAGITRAFTKVALKLVVPGGGRLYGYGNLLLSEVPKLNKGSAITKAASISMDGRMVGYGA
jgi:ribosomal protein S7